MAVQRWERGSDVGGTEGLDGLEQNRNVFYLHILETHSCGYDGGAPLVL